jgi:hypothetical protein
MSDLDYGVWGHVYDEYGKPSQSDVVKVTCTCGGAGFPKEASTNEKGYYEVVFTSEEAEDHNGHSMRADSLHHGEGTDFTFNKPVTGPVNIYCIPPK